MQTKCHKLYLNDIIQNPKYYFYMILLKNTQIKFNKDQQVLYANSLDKQKFYMVKAVFYLF